MELAPVLAAVVAAVNAQANVLRDTMAKVDRWFEQPRTQVRYTVWDRDRAGRKVDAVLFGVWSLCVSSFFFLASLRPGPHRSGDVVVRLSRHIDTTTRLSHDDPTHKRSDYRRLRTPSLKPPGIVQETGAGPS